MAVGGGCDGGLLWLVVMDCGFAFVFFPLTVGYGCHSGVWVVVEVAVVVASGDGSWFCFGFGFFPFAISCGCHGGCGWRSGDGGGCL